MTAMIVVTQRLAAPAAWRLRAFAGERPPLWLSLRAAAQVFHGVEVPDFLMGIWVLTGLT
jgi:hypothetical protein